MNKKLYENSPAFSGMRDLNAASTSSNLGGGAPNPLVVWAARFGFFLFFFAKAKSDVCDDDV